MFEPSARIPVGLRTGSFVLKPLTADLAPLDHAAYMASPDVIRVHSDGRWPLAGFTLDDDRHQIAQHQVDHQACRAFAFLVLDPSEVEALGCVYLNPLHTYLQRAGADPATLAAHPSPSAMVTFWVRQDHQDTDLPTALVETLTTWLRDEWPFRRALFRVLPSEHASCAALEQAALSPVTLHLPEEPRPYRWYDTAARGSRQRGSRGNVPDDLEVRIATEADAAQMRRIEHAAQAILAHQGIDLATLTVPDDLDEPTTHTFAMVAERQREVVGLARLTELTPALVCLDQVSVHPDSAHQGVGRNLLTAVAAEARSRGYTAITGTTFRDVAFNAPFYGSLGGVEDPEPHPAMVERRRIESLVGLDRFGDRIIMRLRL